MHLHKDQLYLLEQHSKSFEIWSAIIRINTEGYIVDYEIGLGTIHQTRFPMIRTASYKVLCPN